MKFLRSFLFFFLFVGSSAWGQRAIFQDTNFASGFGSVNGITFDSMGRCFAWEKDGKVWGKTLDGNWHELLNLEEEVNYNTDCGLKGFALDPHFLTNGYFYLLYEVEYYHLTHYGLEGYDPSASEYEHASIGRITRYTLDLNAFNIALDSRLVLVGRDKNDGFPMVAETHNVGSLVFGTDGTLLASCGESTHYTPDYGSNPNTYYQQAIEEGILRQDDPSTSEINEDDNVGAWRSQLVNSLNGKVIRIDPATGNGVSSNPFYDGNNPRMPQSRVWAMGFRNPFRMTIKPNTGSINPEDANPGEIYVGDVGAGQKEEVDVITKGGQNFGWPLYEGMTDENSPLIPYPENRPEFYRSINWIRPVADYRGAGARAYKSDQVVDVTTFNPGFTIKGNCIIGGVFYNGTNFPSNYQGAYFIGNFDNGEAYETDNWIHALSFDTSNTLQQLLPLDSTAMGVTCIAENPINGYLYYASYVGSIREIKYASANQAPQANVSQVVYWGKSPLAIRLDATSSSDPEKDSLTYIWDFGDNSPVETGNVVNHTFNAPDTAIHTVTATLTVTDTHGLGSMKTVLISLNNTPPIIKSTSVDSTLIYENKVPLLVVLSANIQDKESDGSQLTYQWETALHHNTHNHPNSVSNEALSSVTLSPVPCDGNRYFYRVKLTITDPEGLSTTETKDVVPNCAIRDTIPPSTPQQLIVLNKSETTIQVRWNRAFDNRGIAAYQLFRVGGAMVTTADSILTISDLTSETSYQFYIRAVDVTGLFSPISDTLFVTTLPFHPLVEQDEYLYKDDVASAWLNETSFAGITLREGSGYKIDSFSIKFASPLIGTTLTFQYLNAPLFTSDFPDGISFWVYNAAPMVLPLKLYSFQANGSRGDSINLSALPQRWTPIRVTWNSIGSPMRVSKIAINMNASQEQPLYIDELKLVHCADMTTVKSGDWNDISIWNCGRVPMATDIVTVRQTDTITVLNGVSATMRLLNLLGNLKVQSGGIMDIKSF